MKVTSQSDRFSKDESGQWWYQQPGHSRKRAKILRCPWCKEDYLSSSSRQEFCGHKCAAASRHAGVPATTPKSAKPGPKLRNSDNPRYSRDEKGQWWYQPIGTKQHGRTRASIKTCDWCKKRYLCCVFHRRGVRYCSRSCSLKATNEINNVQYRNGRKGTNWKGGRQMARGYVLVLNREAAKRMKPGTKNPYVFEHRVVMEQVLGRPLDPREQVHHKNGKRDDNRPENLELWVRRQPPGQRVADLLAFAREIIATYEPVEDKVT